MSSTICPECGNILFVDESTGDIVCRSCGLVIGQSFNRGKDWSSYTPEEREEKRRVGPGTNLNIYDKGLSTEIGMDYVDKNGKRISRESRNRLERMRKWDKRSKIDNTKHRNLLEATNILNRLSSELKIPSHIQDTAIHYYRKALDKNLIRGRSISSMVSASLYLAARKNNYPLSIKEISSINNTKPRKIIARDYRMMVRKLNIDTGIQDPIIYCHKISLKLGLDECIPLADEIIKRARSKKLTLGRDSRGIAAAALYFVIKYGISSNENKVTQHDIAKEANITEVTLRNEINHLQKNLYSDVKKILLIGGHLIK